MSKKNENEEIELDLEDTFEYNAVSYVPIFNEERKAYDMWKIKINSESMESIIEIEEMRYDSTHRALHDLIGRVTENIVKGKK